MANCAPISSETDQDNFLLSRYFPFAIVSVHIFFFLNFPLCLSTVNSSSVSPFIHYEHALLPYIPTGSVDDITKSCCYLTKRCGVLFILRYF